MKSESFKIDDKDYANIIHAQMVRITDDMAKNALSKSRSTHFVTITRSSLRPEGTDKSQLNNLTNMNQLELSRLLN